MDLDPERRNHTPEFYGYVPSSSGKRTLLFVSMFAFTSAHVALRLFGTAILALFSPFVTAAVLGGDVLLFLLFKFARNDLRYWLNVDGFLSWVITFLFRIVLKLMVDFTAMVQLRRK